MGAAGLIPCVPGLLEETSNLKSHPCMTSVFVEC